uniref:SB domain-containing protein n=2 Tax=Caenorhabditis tropicalis TaxID=1561998 RepID=A0A1I7UXG6_9PELO
MSAHQVQQCLQRAGGKYVDSAKKDVVGALSQFKDLSPGTDSFMFPDGKRRNAFRLKGTIPVYYKGACYNIPVTVYLWDTHPYYAPICYVNPTATMVIKIIKSNRSPYFHVMAMVFQEKCPVFARSASTTGTATPNSSTTSTPTPTPYPSSQPSMPTPYPTGSGATPYPATSTPYPSAGGMGYNPYMNIPQSTPYPMGGGAAPYPSSSSGPVVPPRPPPVSSQTSVGSGSGTIQSDTIRASVMSAVEEKLRAKLRERLGTNSAEMASIRTTGDELREGQQKLKKMLEELESQRNSLQTACEIYTAKKLELAKALSDAGGTDAPPIDEAIDAAYPLHRQIVLSYVKDLTCDDVIYALGQSLKKNKITTSEYLRRVRDVSREQFIHRATMQKCRRTAGLPI